jgi:dipeptidyl aminopeptidase/acylaminoacyl peptidase
MQDILDAREYVLDKFESLDENRMALAGASYGGYLINWINGQSKLFKCFLVHSGIFDLMSFYYSTDELFFIEWELGKLNENMNPYFHQNPMKHAKNFKTPTLITHGRKDYRVPITQGISTFTALQRNLVESEILIYEDEGHWIENPSNSVHWYKSVMNWFNKFLK